MKRSYLVVVAFLMLPTIAISQAKIPPSVTSAKTIIMGIYWPEADIRDKMEVQHEGEEFVRKWGRFQITNDIDAADLVVMIVVKPTEVQPGFWQRLAAAYASQGNIYCNTNSQNYGGGMVQAQTTCYSYGGNQALAQQALLPTTVLGGSILVYEPSEVKKDMAAGHRFADGDAKPILAAFAEAKGSAPLIGAAKRLKKLISSADKEASKNKH